MAGKTPIQKWYIIHNLAMGNCGKDQFRLDKQCKPTIRNCFDVHEEPDLSNKMTTHTYEAIGVVLIGNLNRTYKNGRILKQNQCNYYPMP